MNQVSASDAVRMLEKVFKTKIRFEKVFASVALRGPGQDELDEALE